MNKQKISRVKRVLPILLCILTVGIFIPKTVFVVPVEAAVTVSEADRQTLKKLEDELAILKEDRKTANESYTVAQKAYEDAEYDYTVAFEAKKALDEEILALDAEIDKTGMLLNVYSEQIETYDAAIEAKELEIEERYRIFLERIRVNYQESFTSYLEIVLSSESFSDLLYRVDVVANLLEYDKRVIAELDQAKKDLVTMQTEYASLKFKAQETYESLKMQLDLLNPKRDESERLLRELDEKLVLALASKELAEEQRQQIITSYEAKKEELDRAEDEIAEKIRIAQEAERKKREEEERRRQEESKRLAAEEESRRVAAEEQRAREEAESRAQALKDNEQKNETSATTTPKEPEDITVAETQTAPPKSDPVVTGSMIWPTESDYTKITSYYGWRTSPLTGKAELHNGIDIPCAYGSAIYAADGGTVIISEYHYSYGNYVVIDHGDGLSTLYAHNSKLLVAVGDTVTKGQQIAQAGSTGDSRGNHCHFCVRINGQHTDPMKYVSVK